MARFTQTFVTTLTSPGSTSIATSTSPVSRWGWVAGIGAETRIARSNWLGRVEYLHYDFGNSGNSAIASTLNGVPFNATDTTGRLTADVVRAGVSYLLH